MDEWIVWLGGMGLDEKRRRKGIKYGRNSRKDGRNDERTEGRNTQKEGTKEEKKEVTNKRRG